jgi:hypothetical protein
MTSVRKAAVRVPVDQFGDAPRAAEVVSIQQAPRRALLEKRPPVIAAGGQIGRYILVELLGQGSFGLVFSARDTVLERAVAIKVLNPAHQYNPDILHRFLQEALASARVVHPGIVTVHDFGTVPTSTGETAYIVLELMQGESLTSRLTRAGRFPIPWAIEIVRQVASALDVAHRAGVLHRDLKSENIYLVPDPAAVNGERVKVLDFGLAKLGPSQHTQMNTVFGTPRYMSPEQCRSAASIDQRSDIYSLGCVLFELLTGRTPFAGDIRQQIEAHKRTIAPRASSFVGEIPPQLDDLIAQTLAKDPNARPQSMDLLQATLYALNAQLASQGTPRVSAAHVVSQSAPHAALAMPVAVAPGVAATILPTAASLMSLAPGTGPVAAMTSPIAHLARQPQVEFARTAPLPSIAEPVSAPAPRSSKRKALKIAPSPPRRAGSMPYHLAPHLPSLKRQPVRAGIAGAAIAFLIAAFLTAVAARGHMKAADASPKPIEPAASKS